jgi:hypothetical protein
LEANSEVLVLLVEDELIWQAELKVPIEEAGFKVIVAPGAMRQSKS